MKLKNLLLPLLTLLAIITFSSCKQKADDTPTEKTTIKLSKASVELKEGESVKLNAILTPKTAKETVTWETSNKEIATVKDNGVVTGVKAGEATITAKLANGNSATCSVNVKAGKKEEPTPTPDPGQGGGKEKPGDKDIIYKLEFDQASYTVEKGKSIVIKAKVTAIGDNELPDKIEAQVTYSGGKIFIEGKGEEQLAIVSTNGKVEGVNLGKCKVKAELKGAKPIECEVEVIEANVTIPEGAKLVFIKDYDTVVTENEITIGVWDSSINITPAFINKDGEKIDIEGVGADSFEYRFYLPGEEKPTNVDEKGHLKENGKFLGKSFSGFTWNSSNNGSEIIEATLSANRNYKVRITITRK